MKTRSLKQGSTPAQTALVYQATVANSNPPVAGIDPLQAGYGPLESCDLLWQESAGGTCDLEVFHYYATPDLYVRDDTVGKISINANEKGGLVLTPSGADGIYVSLTNFAGATLTVHGQAKYK